MPILCTNKDAAVEACTGSGKTLAFVLPMTEILARACEEQVEAQGQQQQQEEKQCKVKPHRVLAMVVSPTRELAAQIFEVGTGY